MYISNSSNDNNIPVKRLSYNHKTGKLDESNPSPLFLKGPIPLEWLRQAAHMPGKTLAVALALWWLHGMSKGGPIKLTNKALDNFNISRDAAYDAFKRLEIAGWIAVTRASGQKPTVKILTNNLSKNENKSSIKNLSDDGSCV